MKQTVAKLKSELRETMHDSVFKLAIKALESPASQFNKIGGKRSD